MTYTIVQKVKDKYYLCEVESKWDPEKKRSRQTRKYLGRCDKDGNLLNDSPVMDMDSRSFGEYYLMTMMAEASGILDALAKVYGESNGMILAAMAVPRALRKGRPSRAYDFLYESTLQEMLSISDVSDWTPLETLIMNMAAAYDRRKELFSLLPGKGEAVVMESTAMNYRMNILDVQSPEGSPAYKMLGFPPLSIMVSYTESDRLPFFFRFMLSDGIDPESLRGLEGDLGAMTHGRVNFLLDYRDWDMETARAAMGSGLRITVPLTQDSKLGRKLLSDSVLLMKSMSNTYVYDGAVYRVVDVPLSEDMPDARAMVFLNERKKSDEVLSLYSRLEGIERKAAAYVPNGRERSRVVRDLGLGDMASLYSISFDEGGRLVMKRKPKAVAALENRCGKMVFISNTGHRWDQIMDLWLRRSELEYTVRLYRMDLEGGARFFPEEKGAFGAFLNEFIAMRMQTELYNRLLSSPLSRKIGMMEILSEMEKLKVIRIGGTWHLSPVTPLQRSILEALDVPVPDDGSISRILSGGWRKRAPSDRT